MHAAGGREGLGKVVYFSFIFLNFFAVDTAIKTAKTGYALRQITNALSDISVDEIFTARNAQGNIVQFLYGGDCIDPVKLIPVKLDYASLSPEQFAARYHYDIETQATPEAAQLIEDEWFRLCKDRKFIQKMTSLPEAFLESLDDGIVRLSVDIDRLILDAQFKFKCGKHAESELHARSQILSPVTIIDRINQLGM